MFEIRDTSANFVDEAYEIPTGSERSSRRSWMNAFAHEKVGT